MTAEQVQAIAAVATFLAAALAVLAAFRAPTLAARFAEKLRVDSQREQERRNAKLNVFATLMQFRAQMANPVAVGALNLIDVVYCESQEVRDAWRHFHAAASAPEGQFSGERLRERYLAIIAAMARDLGLQKTITIGDIQMAYYPTALQNFDLATHLETQEKLRRFDPSALSAGQPGTAK